MYRVKRFSVNVSDVSLPEGVSYIGSQVNNGIGEGLNLVDNVSARLIENEKLGKTRGVKRYGRFINTLTRHIKRKRKKDGVQD